MTDLTINLAMRDDEMEALFFEVRKAAEKDEVLMDLFYELIHEAADYCSIRASWSALSKEEKMDKDSLRTSIHDSLIIKFLQMKRYEDQKGISTIWFDKIGNPDTDRKRFGDAGCYFAYREAVSNR